MSCTNTTAMYLNVSTDICANASASRSGNTITVSGTFSVTQGSSWNYNAIYAYVDGQTSWTKVKPYKTDGGGSWSAGFSFSFDDAGAGTRSYTAIFQVWNNAESGTVGNPASVGFSVSYDAGGTAPSGLSLSNVSVTQDTVTGTVSVTDWGGVGDANSRYRNLSVMQTNDKTTSPRRYQRVYGNTMSSAILVNNNTQYGSMTIKPNTRYWLWWYATNGTYGTSSPDTSTTTVITMPPTPSISDIAVTTTTATVTYNVPDQGGGYTMSLRYQLDGGGSTTVTNLSGSGTKTGTFTISGLASSSSHTLTITLHTTAGDAVSSASSFTTNPVVTGLYGPVKHFDDITSCTIESGTNPAATAVNTSTLVGWLKTRSQFLKAISEGKDFDYISVIVHKLSGTNTCYVTPYLTDGTHTGDKIFTSSSASELAATVLADTGITIITDQSNVLTSKIIPSGVEYVTKSKTIDKLYGPVEVTTVTGVSGTIRSGGAGNVTAFDGEAFWNEVKNTVNSDAVSYLRVISPSGSDRTWYLYLSFSDGTSTQTIASGIERTELATYGITATLQASDTNDYIDLTPITTTTTVTKEITKLYASVNGQAKLVFQSQSST